MEQSGSFIHDRCALDRKHRKNSPPVPVVFLRICSLAMPLMMISIPLPPMEKAMANPVLATSDCKTLRAQRSALTILGVPAYLKKGPAWVQQNLKNNEIYLIRNYIRIQEYIRFRCPPISTATPRTSRPSAATPKTTRKNNLSHTQTPHQ